MSTNKHARGPWTADYNCTTLVLDADGNEVAFVDDSDDARLIAASPCLLAAAEKALAWIDAGMPSETRNVAGDLEAAIAKATQP